MHAPVRNTTFAALVTAGLFAVGPAAHADTAPDDRGPVVDGNEWEPLVNVPIRVCGDSISVLRRLADCSGSSSPTATGEARPLPPAESAQEPHRCGAEEDCPIRDVVEVPEDGRAEQPDGADAAAAEPVQAAEAERTAEAQGRWPAPGGSASSWGGDTGSAVPEAASVPDLPGLPRIPEPVVPPEMPETAAYALTATGSQDAPLLTAGVATVLLGGVAIYVGYGLGRSDRPNLFR